VSNKLKVWLEFRRISLTEAWKMKDIF